MMEAALVWISLNETLLTYLGIISLITLIITPILVLAAIIRMPADYFIYERREILEFRKQFNPAAVAVVLAVKNVAGVVFIIAGLAMLVLPGQGIITILIGLTLVNFPGKRSLERRLVRHKRVFSSINWVRERAGGPPLRLSRD
ncbi:MAG: PGPGW domain-containing protein [Desulfomonilia bacterium]